MVQATLKDLAPKPGAEVVLLINGFGGTPAMELYLMFNSARRLLEAAGLKTARALVGSDVMSLEMAGRSITISILDEPCARLWDAPVHTAALRWGM